MTTADATHEFDVTVPATHPSLPGHFPGRPVVPGVLLLDRVIEGVERWLGSRITVRAAPQVKFVSPLLPEERARVIVTGGDRQVRFKIAKGERTIAQGIFDLSP